MKKIIICLLCMLISMAAYSFEKNTNFVCFCELDSADDIEECFTVITTVSETDSTIIFTQGENSTVYYRGDFYLHKSAYYQQFGTETVPVKLTMLTYGYQTTIYCMDDELLNAIKEKGEFGVSTNYFFEHIYVMVHQTRVDVAHQNAYIDELVWFSKSDFLNKTVYLMENY